MKKLILFVGLLLFLFSCSSDIKHIQNMGDTFYTKLKNRNYKEALQYTYSRFFKNADSVWEAMQNKYGKILSFHREETTVLNGQKILYKNKDTLYGDIAVLKYKVNYEKVSVKERLVFIKVRKINSYPYTNPTYKIIYYQSGYDQK